MAELDSKIIIVDDQNVEHEMNILFTFEDNRTNKKFVVYYDPEDESGDLYASIYDEDGKLYPIEDEKDWDTVQEVLDAYVEENEMMDDEEHECECNHDHDEDHECHCHNHDDEDEEE